MLSNCQALLSSLQGVRHVRDSVDARCKDSIYWVMLYWLMQRLHSALWLSFPEGRTRTYLPAPGAIDAPFVVLLCQSIQSTSMTPCVSCSGEVIDVPTPPGLREAVQTLGLHRALGFVRMLQLSPEDSLVRPDQTE